jgi:2-(1,2-epoxy-1,2-dihydrophenyl)acetyl-CoA isomerase
MIAGTCVMEHIQMRQDGAVGTITIDRPARFNSLDTRTAQDLRRAALHYARDPAIRAMVVRGAGGVFCSGADLKYIAAGGNREDLGFLRPETRGVPPGSGEIFKQILEYLHCTIAEIRRAPKPVIAEVDGVAAAGGLGLALACDLVIVSTRATFEWAYSKTGLTGAESATFFLPRLVGLRRALEMAFLNPRLDARRALELGMVTEIQPVESLEGVVAALAARLAAGPTQAFAVSKMLLNQAAGVDRLDYHLDQELEHLVRSADGAEFAEGLQAFLGKREPVFD